MYARDVAVLRSESENLNQEIDYYDADMLQITFMLLVLPLPPPIVQCSSCVANYTGATSTCIDGGLDGQLVHRMGAIPLLSFLLNTVHVPAQLRVQQWSDYLI